MPKRGREEKSKDDLSGGIESMTLPELTALEIEAIQTTAAHTIAPQGPNAPSDEAEKRVRTLKRELSAH